MNITDKKKLELICQVPIFSKVSQEALMGLVGTMSEKTFFKKEILMEQDDDSAVAFVISSGLVKVHRMQEDGTILNLAVLGPGEIVGEMSLFDNQPRSATVEALEDTDVLCLNLDDFRNFLIKNPAEAFLLMKIIATRLRQIHQKIEERISRDLPKRTYKAILSLSKYYKNDEIPLSQEELAEIVGATRARVTEALDKLKDEGKIELAYRRIRLIK